MCGFAGYLTSESLESYNMISIIKSMSHELIHRGPDDQSSWVDANSGIAMGFCRLAILELSPAGHQPMISNSGRYVITFNGEIYNHKELRERIMSHSSERFAWSGDSDTETILAAVELWGIKETLQACVGMFSIALWDKKEKILTLARDRFGEKPLYYGMVNHSMIFASELKSFKKFPNFNNKISKYSLRKFLQYNYVPTPLSIYEDVYKLEPGSYTQFSIQNSEIKQINYKKYWSLEKAIINSKENIFNSESDAIKEIEMILERSIKNQMQSDVPLGAFLSGGVDSSLIVSIMQKISDTPIKTFTVGFEESSFDESPYARDIAAYLGTEHTEVFVSPHEVRSVIPKLPLIYDEPFADSSQIPTYLVCKVAQKDVTVALSGDAGDELFGGYNRYFWGPSLWKKLSFFPFFIRKFFSKLINLIPGFIWLLFENIINFFLPAHKGINRLHEKIAKLGSRLDWIRSLDDLYFSLVSEWHNCPDLVINLNDTNVKLTNNFIQIEDDSNARNLDLVQPAERMMYQDLTSYLQDDILCKVDRAAMATSLETRIPFLDHNLFKLSWRIPLNMKINRTTGKNILRKVLYKNVPKKLIERPKAGFSLPIGSWLKGPLKDWAEDLLSPERIKREGFLNSKYIQIAWNEHQNGKSDNTYKLWSVLMFQAWLEANRKL